MTLPNVKSRFKLPSRPGGGRKAAGKAPFKGSRGSKFVLLIGDEGAILIYIKKNVVQSRQFVPDGSPQSLEELREGLAIDTKAPILIAIDSMDQSYVQQTLPPVSSLTINKLIKRRLDRDFGANDIKGAIILGKEETGRKDWSFLMISIEKTPQLSAWLDFVTELPNRFKGIFLVSAEIEIIVKALEQSMGVPKEGTGAEWKFFVSHNKVGGFRQVIMRGGKLLFTRMAQPLNESSPEVIAGNIEQEMLSTIEYMKRLSFDPVNGLDIYIIASSAIKSAIAQNRFKASSMHIMTPHEVEGYLGIEGATQPSDQFGDVILAAAIACSSRHLLTLSTPVSKKFDTLYYAAQTQRAAGVLAALGLLIYAGSELYDLYTNYANIEELQQRKAFQQQSLNKLREEIAQSHMNVEKATDLIDLYQQLQHERLTPVPFIAKAGAILRPPIVVKSVEWSLDTKEGPPGPHPKMTAVFTLEFPGVLSAEAFTVVSKKILADFKEAFKDCVPAFTKVPPQFSENEKMDINFNENQPSGSKFNFAAPTQLSNAPEVQLTIKGAVLVAEQAP